MGVSAPHCRRAGNGLLRNDPRTGAQRRRRHFHRPARLRRRGPAFHARRERQRRGGLVRFDGQRRGRHSGEDVVHPHRLEHGPLYLPRGVRVLPRAVRQVGAEDLVDDRCLETALHLLGQVRRQPHGGGGALRRGRRAGGQGPRRTVRRDPRPRLAHLLRGHRRQTRLRQAAGGAHARHGVRPLGRERQHAGLRHRAGRHARRRPRDRRFEPHAQHRHQPLRRSRRKDRHGAQRRALRPEQRQGSRARASPTRS